jgi:hypothetical protein
VARLTSRLAERGAERVGDGAGDLILHGEDVDELAIELAGPDVEAALWYMQNVSTRSRSGWAPRSRSASPGPCISTSRTTRRKNELFESLGLLLRDAHN